MVMGRLGLKNKKNCKFGDSLITKVCARNRSIKSLYLGFCERIAKLSIDLREGFIRRFTEAGGSLRVRSALNPVLWMCAIVSGPSLIVWSCLNNPPLWLDLIVISPVVLSCFAYLFLLFFDRDKLQSEEYQIRKRTLELIEQKGMSGPMTVAAIEAMVTPAEVIAVPNKTMEGTQ